MTPNDDNVGTAPFGFTPSARPRPQLNNLPTAARILLGTLQRLEIGILTFTAPDGHVTTFRGTYPGPHADLRFDDWDVAREVLRSADIGLAECFRDGRVHTSDLTAFLELCARNQAALEKVFYGQPLIALLFRIKHFFRNNSKRQARKNIAAHYDLSNSFYKLWLDSTMSYSSAVFEGDFSRSMEAAQTAKYERVLRELNPPAGARILEIGCGWGGFAEHATRTRSVSVHGVTLSTEQLAFAQARLQAARLDHLASFELIDYRDVEGQYDYIVSIEMFEAVGERYWPSYFQTLHDRLKPGGRAMVQTITIDEGAFQRYRQTSDFIREYIFPGGMLAPVERFIVDAGKAGLSTSTPYRFGLDYAETLKRWHETVNAKMHAIKPLGFDDKFLQLWRFYFCYCEAGFRAGRTDVMQIVLDRAE